MKRTAIFIYNGLNISSKPNGAFKILTKGDNNEVHDRGLYNRGQKWLENGDIVGRVKG